MSDLQRLQRAAFVRRRPVVCFGLLYAATFLGCAVANDLLLLVGSTGLSSTGQYLLPLAVVLPLWLGLRRWSLRECDTA